ncbi:hypothetical protein [Aestuariivita boseongensis]|uniref:hypothetical protein n=1 Tax=Aestuariivita boseongensis TaxID=1470562 RepID=UPI0009E461C8|nr:hypothetical protein [Aestuariivita boseongensis]
MPWDHLDAWAQASESERLYIVTRGTLAFDERDLPQVDWEDQAATPPLTRVEAYFSGHQLARTGFQRPFEGDVTLEVACYGPWCARVPAGAEIIAFLEMRDGALVLETNPCGGFALPASPKAERDLQRCMQGTCP